MSEGAPAGGRDGAAGAGGGPPPPDQKGAHQARVYDYLLGGKENYAADREAGDVVMAAYPDIVHAVRSNRAFLRRVVRYLAGTAGVRQFLDIGTGLPAATNTHEVAQEAAPESRIVYADNDPVVLAHARALLTSSDEGAADYIDVDLRDTGRVLAEAARTLDFSRPVALMLLSVLHVIGDDDHPHQLVARLMDAMPPGSYLALSHPASDIHAAEGSEAADRLTERGHADVTLRDRDEVARFFDGLDLVEPGLAQVQLWRPEFGPRRPAAIWAGLARKA